VWRELIEGLTSEATFGEPASDAAIEAIEVALEQPVPDDLVSLMREVGEVRDKYLTDIVWTPEKIVAENRDFRTYPDFKDLYMPFEPLMFFGDTGDGSRFAFIRRPVRPDVFVWDHESDGRWFVATDLADFLTRAFTATSDDWYQL
jgi:hypothetical protein